MGYSGGGVEHPPLRASHPVSSVTPYRWGSKNTGDPWSCRAHLRGLRIWTPPSLLLGGGCSCQGAAPWKYPISSLLDLTPSFLLIADSQGCVSMFLWSLASSRVSHGGHQKKTEIRDSSST